MTTALAAVLTAAPVAIAPRAIAAPPTAAATFGTTWTVDSAANQLKEYAPGAAGNDAPIVTVSGPATGLHAPSAVALTRSGRIFVANASNDSITEYASDATGNAAPLATISGPRTGLDGPHAIAVAVGEVWVTNPDSDLVESFAVGSNGDEFPARTFAGARTKLSHPIAVLVSAEFGTLTVLNAPPSGAASIESFRADRSGDVKPVGQITAIRGKSLGSPTTMFAVDDTDVWIADGTANRLREVVVLPGAPDAQPEGQISGTSTRLDDPVAISQNALGDLVVANAGDHSLLTYAAGSRGNVAPSSTLSGVAATNGDPTAVAVFGAAPSAPQDVKVDIHKISARVSWQPPQVTGGGIATYEVVAFPARDPAGLLNSLLGGEKGGHFVVTRKTSAHITKLTPGQRYIFLVAAVNAFGGRSTRPTRAAYVLAPSAPRDVRAHGERHALLVTWRPPHQDGGANIGRYTIEYAAGCRPATRGCTAHRGLVSGSSKQAKITGLRAHTTYRVVVIAHNSAGPGQTSRVTRATVRGQDDR